MKPGLNLYTSTPDFSRLPALKVEAQNTNGGPRWPMGSDHGVVLGREVPILDEARLERDGRPAPHDHCVAPPGTERSSAGIPHGDVEGARGACPAVHDEQLAVIAVVEACVDRPDPGGEVFGRLAPRLPQLIEKLKGQLVASHPV